jgi:hypothetical protein
MLAAKAVSEFKKSGYFVIPGVIDAVSSRRLGAFVGGLANGGAGSRRLLDEAWCTHLAGALRGNAKMNSLLPRNAVAVQCTLFDKSPTKNWLVALHQDLSIPVRDRVDCNCMCNLRSACSSSWLRFEFILMTVPRRVGHCEWCRIRTWKVESIQAEQRHFDHNMAKPWFRSRVAGRSLCGR